MIDFLSLKMSPRGQDLQVNKQFRSQRRERSRNKERRIYRAHLWFRRERYKSALGMWTESKIIIIIFAKINFPFLKQLIFLILKKKAYRHRIYTWPTAGRRVCVIQCIGIMYIMCYVCIVASFLPSFRGDTHARMIDRATNCASARRETS